MAGKGSGARDYFISRTNADKDIALASIIREAGHTTWLQDEDFGHVSFMARMGQGLKRARVIALLSRLELVEGRYAMPRNAQDRVHRPSCCPGCVAELFHSVPMGSTVRANFHSGVLTSVMVGPGVGADLANRRRRSARCQLNLRDSRTGRERTCATGRQSAGSREGASRRHT
jgi:hypothetical protein